MKICVKGILLSLLLLLWTTGCKKDDPAPLYIPDDAFLNALIELGVDADGNGEICSCEAKQVISLDVSNKDITDMTGIEAMINLDTLVCFNNQLTGLNISACKQLRWLEVNEN